MRHFLPIILFLIPAIALGTQTGPADEYIVVHDYENEWLVYDYDQKNFFPNVKGFHDNYPAKTIFLDTKKFDPYHLLIKTSGKKTFMFINGSLVKSLETDQWEILEVHNLPHVNKQQETCLTLYDSDPDAIFTVQIALASKGESVSPGKNAVSSISMKPRKLRKNYDGIVSILFIVFAFGTFLSVSYHRAFSRFFSFRELLNVMIRDTSFLVNKPFSRINMIFVVFLSLMTGFLLFMLSSSGVNLGLLGQVLIDKYEIGFQYLNYLILTIFSFGFYMLKFFFLILAGRLFNLEKAIELHYFRIIQYNLLLFSVLILLAFVVKTTYLPFDVNYANMAFILGLLVYIGRFFNLMFTINRTVHVPTLYLISYLCVVEILPITIGLKFLLFQ